MSTDQLDQFRAMLEDVEAEVTQNGSLTLDEVLAELDQIIESNCDLPAGMPRS
jgi:hypothetical protein